MVVAMSPKEKVLVRQGWIGLGLIGLFWPLNWLLAESTFRTAYLFFPLWLGYILAVDGLVAVRTGSSMLNRLRGQFLWLFVASAPAWWLFEAINSRTKNWEYIGGQAFSGLQYAILSSISFSTVMPAVFESAELVRTFRWINRFASGPRLHPSLPMSLGLLVAGCIMLALTLLWPRYFYPFVWGAVFLILEPLNVALQRETFFGWLQKGDWRPVVALSLGALLCGFFWEMWNYYSFPKWVYHTPGAEFWHIFEMPLLGYLGYLPFAWELFALRNFVWRNAPPLRL